MTVNIIQGMDDDLECRLDCIEKKLAHIHKMLHAILQRQGVTQEQVEQLLDAVPKTAEWEQLVGSLKTDTETLETSVKANQ